jgi:hypothetical protein
MRAITVLQLQLEEFPGYFLGEVNGGQVLTMVFFDKSSPDANNAAR